MTVPTSISDLSTTAALNSPSGSEAVLTNVDNYIRAGFSFIAQIAENIRTKLTADLTYYVRTDGSDANNGLANTAGGAFLTIQKAVNVVRDSLDLNGHNVTIQVGNGTYTAGVLLSSPLVGAGNLYIFGNTTTPASCIVSTTSVDAFKFENGATAYVRGFKVQTTTSGIGLVSYLGANVKSQAMDFGACAGAQIESGTGGTILMDGNYSITGGAVSHWHVGSEGGISCGTITVTVTGAPAWSSYFCGVAEGSVSCPNVTFSSTAGSGVFFLAHKNGTIDIGSNSVSTFFPGNAAGSTNTGGMIVTSNRDWTPTPTFSTPGNLSVSYATRKGSWIRIGDLVWANCELVTSAFTHTTASGDLNVTGFPFQSNATSGIYATCSVSHTGITKAGYTQVNAFMPNGSSSVTFPASGSGVGGANVTAADMPSGGTVILRFTMIYRAASTS